MSDALLKDTAPKRHLVQFYGEEGALVRNVARYLREGAERGESLIVIASPARFDAFTGGLPDRDRLTLLDAGDTLSRFMEDGEPDWERFDGLVGRLIRDTAACRGARIRAYGEMVDLLWTSGRLRAAVTLEGFWNRLLETHSFGLFCAYKADVLRQDVETAALRDILRTHSHLLPAGRDGTLSRAVRRAMDEVLGASSAAALLPLIQGAQLPGTRLPAAEAVVLWLRHNLPAYASEVLAKARAFYELEDGHA
jgi:hypothetical protein